MCVCLCACARVRFKIDSHIATAPCRAAGLLGGFDSFLSATLLCCLGAFSPKEPIFTNAFDIPRSQLLRQVSLLTARLVSGSKSLFKVMRSLFRLLPSDVFSPLFYFAMKCLFSAYARSYSRSWLSHSLLANGGPPSCVGDTSCSCPEANRHDGSRRVKAGGESILGPYHEHGRLPRGDTRAFL